MDRMPSKADGPGPPAKVLSSKAAWARSSSKVSSSKTAWARPTSKISSWSMTLGCWRPWRFSVGHRKCRHHFWRWGNTTKQWPNLDYVKRHHLRKGSAGETTVRDWRCNFHEISSREVVQTSIGAAEQISQRSVRLENMMALVERLVFHGEGALVADLKDTSSASESHDRRWRHKVQRSCRNP